MANLDIFEREDLVGHAAKVGAYMQTALRKTFGEHPLVGEVRGVGMVAAIELVKDPARKTRFDPSQKVAPRASAACLGEGVISRALPNSDALAISPPLVITEGEVDEMIARIRRGIDKVADGLTREGT